MNSKLDARLAKLERLYGFGDESADARARRLRAVADAAQAQLKKLIAEHDADPIPEMKDVVDACRAMCADGSLREKIERNQVALEKIQKAYDRLDALMPEPPKAA